MKRKARRNGTRRLKRIAGLCTALVIFTAAGKAAPAQYIEPLDKETAYNADKGEETDSRVNITIVQPERELATAQGSDGASEDGDTLSQSDRQMLLKIAMAEAEDQGTEGMALVMNVVLNRVQSPAFPDSIHDVLYQRSQFEAVANGRYDRVTPDDRCYDALDMVLSGWDESNGATYFCTASESRWHERNLTRLFSYRDHVFYK